MYKKKNLIGAIIVIAGVIKGPFLYHKLNEWYSKKTAALIDADSKVGFGEYLLPPLKFDVFPGDCEPFFSAILKIDLLNYSSPNFSITRSALPILSHGCMISEDPYSSAINQYARECLSDKTKSNEVLVPSCVRSVLNLRASIVDRLFPNPKYREVEDVKLLANLAFAAFVKLDARALLNSTLQLKHLRPNSYTAAKWYAFAMALNVIEYGASENQAKKAIDEARDLYDQDPGLAGLEIFLASKGFKDTNGLVAAKRLLDTFPKSAEAKAWVGYYQWMLGNRETALSLYREAAVLDPGKRDYLNAIKVLEKNSQEDDMVRGKFFPITWNQEDLR